MNRNNAMNWKTISSICVMFATASCVTRVTDFTVLSTKNVNLARMGEYQRQPTRVTGADTKHIIIFIPTGFPDVKEAIDRAIESAPGGIALVDGVIRHKWWYIPYIYGQESYVAEGTVLVDPNLK
jgi:hypothetical protein